MVRNSRGLWIGLSALLAAALLPAGFGAVEAGETVKWRISHTTAPESPYHAGAVKFAEEVAKRSGGAFVIEVHHSGVLGWERETLEAHQLGTLEMSLPGVGPFAIFVPSFEVFNLPFLFRDVDHLLRAFKSDAMDALKKDAEQYGFVVLEIGLPTFRYPMNTKRPINVPADFQGLKIRTMGISSHIDTYKALGANVQTTAFSELYSALQLGVVDGEENFYGNHYTQKFYEIAKYLSEIPVFLNSAAFVVAKSKWDELTDDQRRILREAAAEGVKAMNDLALVQEGEALEAMQKAGVKFNQVPSLEPFIQATLPVREKYTKELAPWVAKIAEQFIGL